MDRLIVLKAGDHVQFQDLEFDGFADCVQVCWLMCTCSNLSASP